MSRQNISFSDDELGIGSADRLVRIISYPRFTEDAYAERLAEMMSLGVTSLVLGGRTIINGTHIAGKGCVGLDNDGERLAVPPIGRVIHVVRIDSLEGRRRQKEHE